MEKNYFSKHQFKECFRILCFFILLISFSGNSQNSKLYSFGSNTYGQLGTGNTVSQNSPTLIGNANNWKIVSAGTNHSLAIKSDGTLWAWGYGSNGRLGTGNTTNQTSPFQIGTGTNWKHVGAGNLHSLAVKTDGTLWAWGNGADGKLGLGTSSNYSQPVQVGTATNWKEVSAGEKHSLALKTDGTIWSWGDHGSGKLGTGTANYQWSPSQIGTANNWIQIVAADDHSLALKSDGSIWAWGSGEHGRLGINNTNQQNAMVRVGTDNDWVMVSTKDSHTLALKSNGTLWGWGRSSRLGNGNLAGNQLTPIQIGTDTDWIFINAGSSFSHAIKSNGTLWAWGPGSSGVLGTGDTNDQYYPIQVGTNTYSYISSAFGYHSLALSSELTCPTSNVSLTSQAEIDSFGTDYQHCTAIVGNLFISGDDITDLTPLSNIISIAGDLHIENSENLTTLEGLNNVNSITSGIILYNLPNLSNIAALSNVTSLGWQINIYNTNLTTLYGLQNITAINGGISITSNAILNDISAIENIAATSISDTGIYIVGNSSLPVCYLDNICTYLANNSQTHPRTITGNAGNCYESAVSLACSGDLSYCIPTPDSTSVNYGIFIHTLSTSGGVNNLVNNNSGFSTNGYGDFSATHSTTYYQGATMSFMVVPAHTNPVNLKIWVDWNNDGLFANDNTELTYLSSAAFTVTHYGSFTIPFNTPGNYRMRVAIYYGDEIASCDTGYYGETEDYTLQVLESVPCETPTSLTVSNVSASSATMSWTSSASVFDVEWGVSGFTLGTGTQQSGVTATSYNLSGLEIGTTYDFYVRQNCSSFSGLNSDWIMYTLTSNGYCVPVLNSSSGNTAYKRYINSVTTYGAVVNINNTDSGYAFQVQGNPVNGYANYSGIHAVSQYQGEYVLFNVIPENIVDSQRLKIWVDWNKDGVFEDNATEIVYLSGEAIKGAHNSFFEIPSDVPVGSYRLRIMSKYTTGALIPCENSSVYGETEDYTLNVLHIDCPAPTVLSASNLTRETATINWTSTGNSFDIEWGLSGFTQGTGITGTTTQKNFSLSELIAGNTYDFYVRQTDCVASSGANSNWKKFSFTTTNYCVDYPNYIENPYFKNFKTYHAETNIYNLDTGLSEKAYGNFSATHIASAVAGDNVSFQYTTVGSLLQTVFVWVDWNNDGILNNTNELVYSLFDQNNGTFNGNFDIPTNAQPGNYRMRLMLLSNYSYTNLSYNASSCNVNFSGETEDYTLRVLGANTCERPTNFTVLSESLNSLLVSWDSSGASFDIEYGQPGFALGSGIQDTSNQPNYLIANFDPTLSYDFYVRQNCGNGNKSYWKLYKLNNYCKPGVHANSNYVSYYITNFSTTNGVTNINNLNSGLSSNNFGNFATSYVSQHQGENIDFSISSSSDTAKRYKIWVDWNNDGVYTDNATEMMHLSPFGYSNQTYQGSFTISANQQPGFYKMRVMHFMNASNESNPNVGPCIVDLLGEVEEYSLQVLENNCKAVTNLAASNIMPLKATLSWSSTGDSFDIEWGVTGFSLGSGTQLSLNETTYLLDNITENTMYDFYVRQNCNDADQGESYWRKVTFTTTSYCTPTIFPYPSTGYFINSFITTGAITNINNHNSGLSVNGYGNFSASHILTHEAGGTVEFTTIKGDVDSSRSFNIYVDWNKDGVFTSSERVYNYGYLSSIVTISGSFTIPSDQAIGNYRMRVVSNTNGMNHTTCGTSYSGEIEDYTLKIVTSTCSIPVEITVTDATANSVQINWTTAGSSFDLEWGLSGFTLGTGTQVSGMTTQNYVINGLEVSTLFDCYVRQNCGVDGTSAWVKVTFNTTPYCTPTVPNQINPLDRIYIHTFTTSNGIANINNINTGYTTYSNFRSLFATQNSGESLSFTAISGAGSNVTSKGLAIWIDWNKNATFDADEKVFTTTSSVQGNIIGSFEIPQAVATGDYRMRVVIMSNNPTNPCSITGSFTYGEIEDYTLKVTNNSSSNCDSTTTWNGTSWSNGIPNANKEAIIEGNLTITDSLTACELLLNSGIVTVNSGAVLTVNGQIVNTQNENNFIVQNDANLIQVDEVENTGSITVKRNAVIKHLDYSTWSSPVLGQKLKAFSPYTLNNRIRIYDAVANTWKIVENPETTDFTSGAGYMFRAPNVSDDGFYPNAYTWTGNFKGVLQNGNVIYDFSNATGAGLYQSIGNPYPSNISRANFHSVNPQIGTLYFWTNTNAPENGVYLGNNYATINRAGEAVNVISNIQGGQNSATPNGYIAVGQGFVAQTNGVINQAVFTNSMRTSENALFLRSSNDEKHRLWLNLSKETQGYNQMLISYNEEATNDVDFGIDSELFGYTGSALYSLINQNDSKYVIQGRALPFTDTDVVPLGFKATEAGIYKVSLSDFDGLFAEDQNVYIKDNLTSVEHNLKVSSYEFISEVGTFNNRFEIVYNPTYLDIANPEYNNNWMVFKQNNQFNIQTQGFEMKKVMVYDMLGRIVYSAKAKGNNHVIQGLDTDGVYIVKVVTNDNIILNKKVQ